VGALLASPATRLLTVTGPGGTGKSRLSLQSAALAEALALLRELEDEPAISHMFFRLAVEARRAADPEQARALCRESLSLHHSVTGEAQTLWLLGDVAFQEGRLEEAFDLLERSARQAGEVGFVWWQLQTLLSYAEYAILVEKPDLAAAPAHEGLELARQIDDRRGMVFGLALQAWLAAVQGRPEDSGRLWGAAEAAAGRAPVGHWEHERDTYEARIVTDTPEFEHGRERGRRLSLEQAIDEALAMSSVPEAGQTSMHTDDGT
jgi:tetratricopeptide (TPR) repeat protein